MQWGITPVAYLREDVSEPGEHANVVFPFGTSRVTQERVWKNFWWHQHPPRLSNKMQSEQIVTSPFVTFKQCVPRSGEIWVVVKLCASVPGWG